MDAALRAGMETTRNLVTVDLDEARGIRARADVAIAAERLLDALEKGATKATFFVSRDFAGKRASLTRRIAERGHEVACLTTAQPATSAPYCGSFCQELEATRDAIEQATGTRVRGHRNVAFAIDYESEWTYDVLVDRGFEYDSSRLPSRYVEFGYEPVPRPPHAVRRWAGTLIEVPVTLADVLAMRVRLGAPGTIRGWPLRAWSALVKDRNTRGEPLVVDLRASELSPRAIGRAGRIVSRFECGSVASALPELYRRAPIVES